MLPPVPQTFSSRKGSWFCDSSFELQNVVALVLPEEVDHFIPGAVCSDPRSATDVLGIGCRDNECLGGRTSAEALLDANEELFRDYDDRRKFFITHLEGAHNTGIDLSHLQDSLSSHLRRLLWRDTLRSSMVVVMGDHGKRVDICDYVSPFFGLFLPRSVGDELQQIVAQSSANLMSPWDLYASLRDVIDLKLEARPWPQRDAPTPLALRSCKISIRSLAGSR